MATKNQKRRNRMIAWTLAALTSYILLVNNSLEFLKNFGIGVQPNVIGVIMIFITITWAVWKSSGGEF